MAFLGQNPYQVSQFCFTIRVCSILVLISDCVTIQYGTVRCGAVQCGAVWCGAVRVRCGAVWVRCGAVRVRCGAVRYAKYCT